MIAQIPVQFVAEVHVPVVAVSIQTLYGVLDLHHKPTELAKYRAAKRFLDAHGIRKLECGTYPLARVQRAMKESK